MKVVNKPSYTCGYIFSYWIIMYIYSLIIHAPSKVLSANFLLKKIIFLGVFLTRSLYEEKKNALLERKKLWQQVVYVPIRIKWFMYLILQQNIYVLIYAEGTG